MEWASNPFRKCKEGCRTLPKFQTSRDKRLWYWNYRLVHFKGENFGIKWRTLVQDKLPISLNSQARCSAVLCLPWMLFLALCTRKHLSSSKTQFKYLLSHLSSRHQSPEGPTPLVSHPTLGTLFPGLSCSLRPRSVPCREPHENITCKLKVSLLRNT